MTIKVGDKIPSVTLMQKQDGGPKPVKTDDLFAGKKVVLFALPGAFTPTCSAKHLPGFIQNADTIRAKGVDAIACLSVNDAFVMGAWGDQQGAGDKIMMLADGNGEFTKAVGLEMDGSRFGAPSRRHARRSICRALSRMRTRFAPRAWTPSRAFPSTTPS